MKRILFLVLVCTLPILSLNSHASGNQVISVQEIIDDAVQCDDCLDWKVIGICFWLKCSLFSCSIHESTKVGHYIPEVVIGTYSTYSPFVDMDFYGDTEPAAMSRKESTDDGETFINFKHAEIFGNPAIPFYMALADSSNLFCKPSATPFMPYFVDKYDPFWSDPDIERLFPQSILGFPQIATKIPTGYWAPEYPRCGWGAHPTDAINGAVAAQRVAEIATTPGSPHIYQTIPNDGCHKGKCWPPKPVQVNKDSDNHFQLILPVKKNSAGVIGGDASWANGKNKSGQTYAWNLWRHYKCCEKKGQVFLYSIDW